MSTKIENQKGINQNINPQVYFTYSFLRTIDFTKYKKYMKQVVYTFTQCIKQVNKSTNDSFLVFISLTSYNTFLISLSHDCDNHKRTSF